MHRKLVRFGAGTTVQATDEIIRCVAWPVGRQLIEDVTQLTRRFQSRTTMPSRKFRRGGLVTSVSAGDIVAFTTAAAFSRRQFLPLSR